MSGPQASATSKVDAVLVGTGIMSATLSALLRRLEPSWSITLVERLDGAAAESSDPWNNAGTGHAGLCELSSNFRTVPAVIEWVNGVFGHLMTGDGQAPYLPLAPTRPALGDGHPPVLVAGIYGMNFKNMPEYDWTFGYAWGWGLIILTTLIPLGVFRWRKWI